METIQAKVNQRLLTKADRLFTGSLDGRIIELLQNARRAGATKVEITNQDGWVVFKDNGQGIADFSKLLDLGGSGWDEACEKSEDPAGVGIFCLAPREVTIRSRGKAVTVTEQIWSGVPVEVASDPEPVRKGTILRFQDVSWGADCVTVHAAYSGMRVVVDGKKCPKVPFVSGNAIHHPELGCRIEVLESTELSQWHNACRRKEGWYGNKGTLNFHGQIVTFYCHPVHSGDLHYLVDLTGEPTGIRLMLPARTQLVENDAYRDLIEAIEIEAYRYIAKKGGHKLPYNQFLRAKELGITLPEADPTFDTGLLFRPDLPEPVEVSMPLGFPLEKCYRFSPNTECDDTDETNAHLLAALGTFDEPFVPVSIRSDYDGYSWARLPTIDKVEVQSGKELHSDWLWSGKLTCVDRLGVTIHTSDGKVFSSMVCMAKATRPQEEKPGGSDDHMLVTPAARNRLDASKIWFHLGGWYEDGDTYETQETAFENDLNGFWADLVGPDEHLRQTIVESFSRIRPEWKAAHIYPDGRVWIEHADGTEKTIMPPL